MTRIQPDWSVPKHVHAWFTTRIGGCSHDPYCSLNLGGHVGDDEASVVRNRELLGLPDAAVWLNQVHSNRCLDVDHDLNERADDDRTADASFTRTPQRPLVVMVADCLPILLSNLSGTIVGVIHAGWKGLANGVISEAVAKMDDQLLIAWLGPAIGPCHYEVGHNVREQFEEVGFLTSGDRWRMDLYAIAREQLQQAGVSAVFGEPMCTFCDEERFYSYRRDGVTGRMAGVIWLD